MVMAKRSSVQGLPPQVKTWLDHALVEGNFSGYQSLEAELQKLGYQISKSAIHRYGQQFEERLSALKLVTEQARAVVNGAPDDEDAVNQALVRMVQEKLFSVVMEMEVDPAKVNLSGLTRSIAELSRSSIQVKKYAADVKAAAQIAADKVEKIARKGGLSSDAVQTIRKEILGIG